MDLPQDNEKEKGALMAGIHASECGIYIGDGCNCRAGTSSFVQEFNLKADAAHQHALAKGFDVPGVERSFCEIVVLMHTELSEAIEAYRHGNPPDDHIPDFSGIEAEFADVVIRIMNAAAASGYRVAEAIEAKMAYNMTRPFKHGKTI